MTLKISEILERVYASTALATLSASGRVALLHPDHAEALRLVVRDSVAAISASLGRELIGRIVWDKETITLDVACAGADTDLAREAFVSAAATLALAQVKIAASDSAREVLNLASILPALSSGVENALRPSPGHARIMPA